MKFKFLIVFFILILFTLTSNSEFTEPSIRYPVYSRFDHFESIVWQANSLSFQANPAYLKFTDKLNLSLSFQPEKPDEQSMPIMGGVIIPSGTSGNWGLSFSTKSWNYDIYSAAFAPNLRYEWLSIGGVVNMYKFKGGGETEPGLNLSVQVSGSETSYSYLENLRFVIAANNIFEPDLIELRFRDPEPGVENVGTLVPINTKTSGLFAMGYEVFTWKFVALNLGYIYETFPRNFYFGKIILFDKFELKYGESPDYLTAGELAVNLRNFNFSIGYEHHTEKTHFSLGYSFPISRDISYSGNNKSSDSGIEIDKEDLLKKAENALTFEDYFEAVYYYRLILESDPDDDRVKEQIRNTKEEAYQKWRAGYRFMEISSALGAAREYFDKGRYIMAELKYQEVLELDSTNTDAQNGMLEVLEKKKKEIDTELKAAERSLRNQDYSSFFSSISKVIYYDPNNARAKRILADFETEMMLLSRDSNLIQLENLELRKEIDILKIYIAAQEHLEKGDTDQAIEMLTDANELYPENELIQNKLTQLKNPSMPVNTVDNEQVKMLYKQGLEQFSRGEYESAIQSWEKVLELDPDNKAALRGIQRAKKMLELGD